VGLKDKETLKTAENCGEILTHIIGNVLDVSKLQAEKIQVEYNPCNIREILQKIYDISMGQSRIKGINLILKVKKNVPVWIKADSNRLIQVFINLVGNAIKFTDRGRVVIYVSWLQKNINGSQFSIAEQSKESDFFVASSKYRAIKENSMMSLNEQSSFEGMGKNKIRGYMFKQHENNLRKKSINCPSLEEMKSVSSSLKFANAETELEKSSEQTQGTLKIEIIDTGIGLGDEEIAKLFKPFTQAHQTTSKNFGGTGLGLWISKKLINKMGGDIKVISTKGKGSDFICTFPMEVTKIRDSKKDIECERLKMRVLFVEDQLFNQKIIKGMLERLNMQVFTANNGQEGLELFKKYGSDYFDFIITDLNMPVVDGKELIQRVREYEEEFISPTRTPIIVLTGNNDEHEKEVCLKLGADYFWTKPMNIDRLQQVIPKLRRRQNIQKILIVDGDLPSGRITQMLLEEEGFSVIKAATGTEALDIINEEYSSIHMVITDAEVPLASGYEIAQSVRKNEKENMNSKLLPIICISQYSNTSHHQRAIEAGINHILLKPVNKKTLIEHISLYTY